jgi:hypothetical protein
MFSTLEDLDFADYIVYIIITAWSFARKNLANQVGLQLNSKKIEKTLKHKQIYWRTDIKYKSPNLFYFGTVISTDDSTQKHIKSKNIISQTSKHLAIQIVQQKDQSDYTAATYYRFYFTVVNVGESQDQIWDRSLISFTTAQYSDQTRYQTSTYWKWQTPTV